jgi:hypothetical protein
METVNINNKSNQLLQGIEHLFEQTGRQVAVYLNTTISRLYWSIGNYIIADMQHEAHSQYGQQIVATLSPTLSWSHFIELVYIDKLNKSIAIAQENVKKSYLCQKIARH